MPPDAPGPEVAAAPGDPRLHAPGLLARLRALPPSADPVRIVGIDGRSGSGKTALALAVASRLRCPVVHLDDTCAGWDGLADAVRAVCRDVVVPLLEGRRGGYRRYDWLTGTSAEWVDVPAEPVVLLEGVGALAGECADRYALRVWLEAPPALRRARALARDGAAFAPYWDRWAAQEDALFAGGAARRRADLVLRTGG